MNIYIYLLIPYIQKYSLTVLAGPIKRIMSSNSPAKIKCWKLSLEWVYDIWWSPICMTLNQYTRRIRNQILRIRQACEFQSSINTRGVYAIKNMTYTPRWSACKLQPMRIDSCRFWLLQKYKKKWRNGGGGAGRRGVQAANLGRAIDLPLA